VNLSDADEFKAKKKQKQKMVCIYSKDLTFWCLKFLPYCLWTSNLSVVCLTFK
jgi:hypothetical protein